MYVLSGIVFSRKDIPRLLKIVRITGLALVIILLVFITMIFFSYADYASISLNLDTGWGQMQSIHTERNIGLVEGWQMVRLSVRNMRYN